MILEMNTRKQETMREENRNFRLCNERERLTPHTRKKDKEIMILKFGIRKHEIMFLKFVSENRK